MPSPGDKVKDCEVIAPLGAGGMASLYLARRRGVGGFSRLVTLKLVHPHLVADESIIKLFLEEARISGQIAHPNVVHVEDVGEHEGSYFIAMEYVHGVSLAELLARLSERQLRLRRKLCVWLAAQVAEALHAVHEARGEQGMPLGIVHRDVSPQNVLIGHNGHVKLIDFGIAKSQAETDHRTSGRPVLGKLRYMSPEQLRLERIDRRVDVYALGVMLWEMLTGRSLLRCQRFDDERDWATREDPPPPSRYAEHAPCALDRVVLQAIAYAPHERYDSAFQFRRALLRVDPEAARIDATLVAGLMCSLFGDELERRRAHWPREIVAALDATPGVTVSRAWSLDELTDTVAALASERLVDDVWQAAPRDDDPTLARHAPLGERGSRMRAAAPALPSTAGPAHTRWPDRAGSTQLVRSHASPPQPLTAARRCSARAPVPVFPRGLVVQWHGLLLRVIADARAASLRCAPHLERVVVRIRGMVHAELAPPLAAMRRSLALARARFQRLSIRSVTALRARQVVAVRRPRPARSPVGRAAAVVHAPRPRAQARAGARARQAAFMGSARSAPDTLRPAVVATPLAPVTAVRGISLTLWVPICFLSSFFISTLLQHAAFQAPAANGLRTAPGVTQGFVRGPLLDAEASGSLPLRAAAGLQQPAAAPAADAARPMPVRRAAPGPSHGSPLAAAQTVALPGSAAQVPARAASHGAGHDAWLELTDCGGVDTTRARDRSPGGLPESERSARPQLSQYGSHRTSGRNMRSAHVAAAVSSKRAAWKRRRSWIIQLPYEGRTGGELAR
jgi:serine/threonine-protein kinase